MTLIISLRTPSKGNNSNKKGNTKDGTPGKPRSPVHFRSRIDEYHRMTVKGRDI